MEVAFNNGKET